MKDENTKEENMNEENMNRILLLETGGTIASAETGEGLAPSGAIKDFFTKGMEIERKQLFSLDSSSFNPGHWQRMAREIAEGYNRYNGFVISHGTDTMQYTAAALHYMLRNLGKPVVLTGSQIPLTGANSDGYFNLKSAFVSALTLPGGVYVVFGGKIIRGVSAVKVNSVDREGFLDVAGEFGITDGTGVTLFQKGGEIDGAFYLKDRISDKVFYLKVTPVFCPGFSDYILAGGYKGVVVESYGLGGIPPRLLSELKCLTAAGVRVIAVSQCLYGGVNLEVYQVGRRLAEAGVESGGNMTGTHALIKLCWETENAPH